MSTAPIIIEQGVYTRGFDVEITPHGDAFTIAVEVNHSIHYIFFDTAGRIVRVKQLKDGCLHDKYAVATTEVDAD